jgi:hypothetical protein
MLSVFNGAVHESFAATAQWAMRSARPPNQTRHSGGP